MTSDQFRRIVAVTIGLIVAGAVFGAVAGVMVLGLTKVIQRGFGAFDYPLAYLAAATIGGILGAGCAPLAGWLLLKRVPLGRAFAWLTVGTIGGGVVGWFLPSWTSSSDEVLYDGAIGFLVVCRSTLTSEQ